MMRVALIAGTAWLLMSGCATTHPGANAATGGVGRSLDGPYAAAPHSFDDRFHKQPVDSQQWDLLRAPIPESEYRVAFLPQTLGGAAWRAPERAFVLALDRQRCVFWDLAMRCAGPPPIVMERSAVTPASGTGAGTGLAPARPSAFLD